MYKRKGMQYFLSWVVVICCGTNLIAQTRHNYNKYIIDESLTVGKRVINLNTLDTVARRDRISDVSDFAAISPDGNYCSFVIKGSEDYTSVQSTKSDWTRKLSGVRPGFFSGDNQYYIYQSGDSLCYLSLKKGALTVIKDVVSYQSSDRRNEWLAIELKNKTLLLRNIVTGIQKQFKDVSNYAFSKSGDWFSCQLNNEVKELFTTQLSTWETHSYQHVKRYRFGENPRVLILETDEGGEKKLQWVNSLSGKKTIVWTSANNEESSVISYSMNQSTTGLVFIIQSVLNDKIKRSVWYYREGMLKAVEKEFHNIPGMMEQLEITEATVTDNGRYIIVSMHEPTMAAPAPNQDAVKVDVWNYKDTILMSSQLLGDAPGLNDWLKQKVFKFSLPSEGEGSLTYLSGAYEQLFMPEGDYALLGTDVGTDRFWENWASGKSAQFLISLRNGKRNCLREGITFTRFSPDGSWLLCYDSKMGQYLRYDIDVGLYTDLSGPSLYFGGEDEFESMGRQPQLPRGIAGWLEGSNGLLVYDHYDIWQLDITGKKTAKNLTNGRKNNIRFMITPDETGEGGPCAMYKNGKTFFESNSRLVLTALNMENKDNGFYTLSLGNKPLLERLYMGPYMFYHGDLSYGQARLNIGCKPLKARDTDVWLLTRQSATEAPNYYVTRGMKEFKRLTALQPHKDYNWLQAELINFEQQDGSHSKGILYKPENFDSSKKYPVIIHYYTQYSLFLNQYQKFDYTESADINIPWFVTRGYLIFMADIYFNKDWAGDAAVNAVEGAASWLAKQSYVDSTKMGIAGHSWGGTLTNYLVTHTNRFAAAFCGAAGASDVIGRGLLPERGDGSVNLKSYESYLSQTIWENSEKWIKASPVMSAHKITTPYLIYHCAIEGVPFQQATEMFVAMRRLGKKVWLLQYDESWHSTQNERDSRDLTIRVTQFFDHYLKGAHAPVWMTRGIRAQFKGIETGYEIDESGRLP